jgi:cadmium resistance protein CadD (predicted permease)
MLALLVESVAAFVATNVDDLFILLLLFAASTRPRTVVWGQYAGLGAIVAISAVVALGALALPAGWIGWLGILPFAIGVRALFGDDDDDERDTRDATSVLAIAAITVANGADNVAVYVPIFGRRLGVDLAVMLAVFAILVGAWCALAHGLTRLPLVARGLDRWGHRLAPWILMALGVYVFVDGGALAMVRGWLA